jgi:very-short-patch-repair endonuclease
MSMKKKAEWMKKQLYKDLYKDHREVGKKKYMEGQAKSMASKMTAPEKKFDKMMKKMGVNCEAQKILNDVIYDFYLPDHNILVEIDGDYFHGNPKVYSEGDLNHMQVKNKKNDLYKNNLAKGLGYGLERIWEKDINEKYRSVWERFEKYKTE